MRITSGIPRSYLPGSASYRIIDQSAVSCVHTPFYPHSLFDSQLYSGPPACTSGARTELIRFYYGVISVISVRLPRGDARAAPTWPVSDFILIRSVIIGEPAEEKTAPAGPVGRGAMNEAPEVSRADPRASQTI